jgi:hypothetical protein
MTSDLKRTLELVKGTSALEAAAHEIDLHLSTAQNGNRAMYEAHDRADGYLSPLFHFVRSVKSHPALMEQTAEVALKLVEGWLMRKGYGDVAEAWRGEFDDVGIEDGGDAQIEFIDVWDRIKWLPGQSWLDAAWQSAKGSELERQIRDLPQCHTKKYGSFLALAAELQALCGDEPILLPVRKIGELLGLDKTTITRCRKFATSQGLLRVVTPHHFGSGRKLATELRFDRQRLESLLAAQKQKVAA